MSDERYDVFISHRRKDGWKDARLLYLSLQNKGYKVYLDVENPKPGQIDMILSKVIDNSDHFVIVLTPGALDRCWDTEDWVRLEVEKAYKSHKNIIPVLTDGFSFPKELPESLRFLKKQGGLTVNQDFYGDFINKLVTFFVPQPKPPKPQAELSKPQTETPTDNDTPVQTGEISDRWSRIIEAIDDGSAKKRYAVGAWKPLYLGRFGCINMQLAGFKLDERDDGKGKVATTWIAKELLPERRVLCTDRKKWRDEGWAGSDLRQWLWDEVLPTIPSKLRDRLVSVRKKHVSPSGYQTVSDTLWIPSRTEVFGEDSRYYELFQNKDSNRVKRLNRNGSIAWWLRSAGNGKRAISVTRGGRNYYTVDVNTSGGVAIGFCL